MKNLIEQVVEIVLERIHSIIDKKIEQLFAKWEKKQANETK